MSVCTGCPLDSNGYNRRVCIQAPSENLKGCIISRDPTNKFDMNNVDAKEYKGNLKYCAPPRWLFERIQYYRGLSSKENESLKNFLDCQCYWTHFHKCPTIKGNDQFHFRYSNGKRCADRWFEKEFQNHDIKKKIIILLGGDLWTYFHKEERASRLLHDNYPIFLPHPSSANCGNGWSWKKNTSSETEIKNAIEDLLSRIT